MLRARALLRGWRTGFGEASRSLRSFADAGQSRIADHFLATESDETEGQQIDIPGSVNLEAHVFPENDERPLPNMVLRDFARKQLGIHDVQTGSQPSAMEVLQRTDSFLEKHPFDRHSEESRKMQLQVVNQLFEHVVRLHIRTGAYSWDFLEAIVYWLVNYDVFTLLIYNLTYHTFCVQTLLALRYAPGQHPRYTVYAIFAVSLFSSGTAPLEAAMWSSRHTLTELVNRLIIDELHAPVYLARLLVKFSHKHDWRPIAMQYVEAIATQYANSSPAVKTRGLVDATRCCVSLGIECTTLIESLMVHFYEVVRHARGSDGALCVYYMMMVGHSHRLSRNPYLLHLRNQFQKMTLSYRILSLYIMVHFWVELPSETELSAWANLRACKEQDQSGHVSRRYIWEISNLARCIPEDLPWRESYLDWLYEVHLRRAKSIYLNQDLLLANFPFLLSNVRVPYGMLNFAGILHKDVNSLIPWPKGYFATDMTAEQAAKLPGVPVGVVIGRGIDAMLVSRGFCPPTLERLRDDLAENGWVLAIVDEGEMKRAVDQSVATVIQLLLSAMRLAVRFRQRPLSMTSTEHLPTGLFPGQLVDDNATDRQRLITLRQHRNLKP